VRNGHIKRITDPDIQSLVIEIAGTNVRWALLCARRGKKEGRTGKEGQETDKKTSKDPLTPAIFFPPLQHDVYHVPRGPEGVSGHQAAIPRDDHQEHEEVLYL
jgi:hypothetical protein